MPMPRGALSLCSAPMARLDQSHRVIAAGWRLVSPSSHLAPPDVTHKQHWGEIMHMSSVSYISGCKVHNLFLPGLLRVFSTSLSSFLPPRIVSLYFLISFYISFKT